MSEQLVTVPRDELGGGGGSRGGELTCPSAWESGWPPLAQHELVSPSLLDTRCLCCQGKRAPALPPAPGGDRPVVQGRSSESCSGWAGLDVAGRRAVSRDNARGPPAYRTHKTPPEAHGRCPTPPPHPKLTSSPEAPLPLSASSTELAVTLLACERYRLVPASGPGPPPPTLPSLECGNHVDCYLPWYPHRPPKGAMPNVAW